MSLMIYAQICYFIITGRL